MVNSIAGFVRAKVWPLAMIVCAAALAYYLFSRPRAYNLLPYLVGEGVGQSLSRIGSHFGGNHQLAPLAFAIAAIGLRSSTVVWFLFVAILSGLSQLAFVVPTWIKGITVLDAHVILLRIALPSVALGLCLFALSPSSRETAAAPRGYGFDKPIRIAAIVASAIALLACLSVDHGGSTVTNYVQIKVARQPELFVLVPAFLSMFFDMRAAPWLHGLALLYLFDDIWKDLDFLGRYGQHLAQGELKLLCAAASAVALGCATVVVLRNSDRSEAE